MADIAETLTFAEFTSGALDSLSWYDVGNGAKLDIPDCPPLPLPIDQDLSTLEKPAFLAQVQVLSALCLTHRLRPDLPTLRTLAFQTSQVMSRELTKDGDRALRMWAQRLNYALQPLICAAEPLADLTDLIAEQILPGSKPWDALQRAQGEMVWITSDPKSLHVAQGSSHMDLDLNLPTQIDVLEDGSLSIGSLYSPGATILHSDGTLSTVQHDAPVLVVFDWLGSRYGLDKNAVVTECSTGRVVYRAPCPQVHFARFFDGTLYLLNNGDFGHVTLLGMMDGQITRQPTLPVQVCNDILVLADSIYLIDKQQGQIFAFDRNWNFRGQRLSFGSGPGQLCDPVSLRRTQAGMACVSWLSGKYTEVRLF